MYPVKVYTTTSNLVAISQETFGIGESVIVINPAQVDLLIKWLQDSKKELEQD